MREEGGGGTSLMLGRSEETGKLCRALNRVAVFSLSPTVGGGGSKAGDGEAKLYIQKLYILKARRNLFFFLSHVLSVCLTPSCTSLCTWSCQLWNLSYRAP